MMIQCEQGMVSFPLDFILGCTVQFYLLNKETKQVHVSQKVSTLFIKN